MYCMCVCVCGSNHRPFRFYWPESKICFMNLRSCAMTNYTHLPFLFFILTSAPLASHSITSFSWPRQAASNNDAVSVTTNKINLLNTEKCAKLRFYCLRIGYTGSAMGQNYHSILQIKWFDTECTCSVPAAVPSLANIRPSAQQVL